MSDNDFKDSSPRGPEEAPKMIVNEYGSTVDSAVVVEEADRTVLLTDNETIVFPKEPRIDIVPKNRPRKVYGGMWGQTEIATVGLAVLAVLASLLLYLFVVVPSNRELEKNRADRDRLERDLTAARAKYGEITSTESQVARLMTSVDNFESTYLPAADNGRTSLYQRVNGLIAAYGLVNTAGPDFAPLETAGPGQNAQADDGGNRGKFRSLFPGVYMTMTVEGSYQNLRRFLREIEAGNEFVVVSSVQIEPTEAQKKEEAPVAGGAGFPATGPPGMGFEGAERPARTAAAQRGRTRGGTVSLRLEMAAYFRRPNAALLSAPQ